jgi:hypothetical protein
MRKSLYHYKKFNSDHLLGLLRDHKIKLSRPDSFNDPWDCRAHYHFPADAQGRKRLIDYLADINRKHCPWVSVMWAHYADQHKGVCLEFDRRLLPAEEVRYQTDYPPYDFTEKSYEPLVTKSVEWSYEKEWRVIAEERSVAQSGETLKTDDGFLVLPERALKSVIIGCRAEDATPQTVAQLAQEHAPKVIVRQAEVSEGKYELWFNPPV